MGCRVPRLSKALASGHPPRHADRRPVTQGVGGSSQIRGVDPQDLAAMLSLLCFFANALSRRENRSRKNVNPNMDVIATLETVDTPGRRILRGTVDRRPP
jgi:hypothetical protein